MNKQRTSPQICGFPPLVQPGSRLLILGSMPGEKSLEQQEYYAHPRNLFWPFIAALADETAPQVYAQKKELLARLNIALWDVCDTCFRQGSLDTAIRQEVPNDISGLLQQHPAIRTLVFNGQKAAALYRKYFKQEDALAYLTLPSTSPANAGISLEDKRKAWLGLKGYLHH